MFNPFTHTKVLAVCAIALGFLVIQQLMVPICLKLIMVYQPTRLEFIGIPVALDWSKENK